MKKTLVLAGLVVGVFFFLLAPKAFATTMVVSGDVLDTEGAPLQNVEIWIYKNVSDHLTAYTDINGEFFFTDGDFAADGQPLSNGDSLTIESRNFEGYNKTGTSQLSFTWQGVIYEDSPIHFIYMAAPKIISGKVTFNPSGDGAANVDIVAYPLGVKGVQQVADRTDEHGDYSFALRADVPMWSVKAIVNLSDHNTHWLPMGPAITTSFSNNDDPEINILNFTVEATFSDITVEFNNASGEDIANADCAIFRSDGVGTIRKLNSESKLTSIGLPPGIYTYWCTYAVSLEGESFVDNTFVLGENEQKDLGIIQAQEDTATISGRATFADSGQPFFNQQIFLTSGDSPKIHRANTDGQGDYSFTVGPGTWTVSLSNPTVESVRMVEPKTVYIPTNGFTSEGNDFQVYALESQIGGEIRDQLGQKITSFAGSVSAKTSDGQYFSSPVLDGLYTLRLPSSLNGEIVSLGATSDVGSKYYLAAQVDLTVANNVTQNLAMTEDDATISGSLLDGDGTAITPNAYEISVLAMDERGNLRKTNVETDGGYNLSVGAGDWSVMYKIDNSNSDYLDAVSQDNKVAVAAGSNNTLNLTVKEKQGVISGMVLDNDGQPVQAASVIVTNLPILKLTDNFNPCDIIELYTTTNNLGSYEIEVPVGSYFIYAGTTPLMDADNIMSAAVEATISQEGGVAEADLTFGTADATIAGVLKNGSGDTLTSGKVAAYNNDGSYQEKTVGADGSFSLPARAGEEWNVLATSLDGQNILSAQQKIASVANGENTISLVLVDNNIDLQAPLTKAFDSATFASITMPDGSTVEFSPYSIDDQGEVTVTVEPAIDLSSSAKGQQISVSYEITARNSDNVEVANLNNPVKITVPYSDETLNANGVEEDNLSMQYFAENEGFTSNDGVVSSTNTSDNNVVAYSDHLTRFSVNGIQTQEPQQTQAFLATPRSNYKPQVKVFDKNGNQISSFYAYSSKSNGEVRAIYADVNGDEINEIITVPGKGLKGALKVFTPEGVLIDDVVVYKSSFKGGLYLTAGDYDKDGKAEIAVAPESGYKSQVKVYDLTSGGKLKLKTNFYAYAKSFKGGVDLATGDLNGDGKDELITSTVKNGEPRIKVFYIKSGSKFTLKAYKDAFVSSYKNGASIAIGDLDGNGKDEIIIAPRIFGTSTIKAYYLKGSSLKLLKVLSPFENGFAGAAAIVCGDVNGDNKDELVASPKTGGLTKVRVYKYSSKKFVRMMSFSPYGKTNRKGANLTAIDLDNDGKDEVVVAPYLGKNKIKIYNLTSKKASLLDSFYAFSSKQSGGVNLGR